MDTICQPYVVKTGDTDVSGAVQQFHGLSRLLLLLPHMHWPQWLPGCFDTMMVDEITKWSSM